MYFSVREAYERMTEELEDLPRQTAYAKIGRRVTKIRTATVPRPRRTAADLAAIREGYAQRLLAPREDVAPTVDRPAPPAEAARPPLRRRGL